MSVIAKTGATVRSWGMMYSAVAQLVLLYVSESWLVIGEIIMVLEGFHHREARRIKVMTATRGKVSKCE